MSKSHTCEGLDGHQPNAGPAASYESDLSLDIKEVVELELVIVGRHVV